MSKLDPRPEYNGPLHSWDNLNSVLQTNFNKPGKNFATIDLRKYSIPKDEIITEANKQGYKVSENGEHFLRFE
ncbi:hypothetical protein [Alkalihalobacterium alkalinitrilicum]|uniref:hypothetical protein n=1 Tax=Alkalihalobacterium alkalinitrilicum TaxID=427920 RepID=UPI00099511AA|nr:hypothetical protein [Alkalihalobacterium alkalinitrilicum]